MIGREWYDERGKIMPGHPPIPGAGHPRRGTNISEALSIRLDQSVCEQIADMMIERTLKGDRAMLEIVLDRSEGKVALAMVQDSIINVVHHIPRPGLGNGTSDATMQLGGPNGDGVPDDLSPYNEAIDGHPSASEHIYGYTDIQNERSSILVNGPLEPDDLDLDLGEL